MIEIWLITEPTPAEDRVAQGLALRPRRDAELTTLTFITLCTVHWGLVLDLGLDRVSAVDRGNGILSCETGCLAVLQDRVRSVNSQEQSDGKGWPSENGHLTDIVLGPAVT